MKYYEILYIVNPNYEQERLSKAMDNVWEELKKYKVEIINHRVWGKKRLAYMVQNHKYGTFVILQYGTEDTGFMTEFNVFMKLNKAVLRAQTVSLKEKPEEFTEEDAPEILAEEGFGEELKTDELATEVDIPLETKEEVNDAVEKPQDEEANEKVKPEPAADDASEDTEEKKEKPEKED
jgi:small subunit ribosomal protein S6